MFNKLKTSLVQDMVNSGVIEEEDAELYCFGFDTLKTYLYAIVITLVIGIIMHSFWESVVFLISFKLLRTTAGGYHAANFKVCFVESSVILIVALKIVKYSNFFAWWMFSGLILVNIVIVFLLAPLPDDNKPITDKEREYHKRKSRIVVLFESVIVVGLSFGTIKFSVVVLMAESIVSCLLLAWVIVRKFKLNMKDDSLIES